MVLESHGVDARPAAIPMTFQQLYMSEYRSLVGLGYVLTGSQFVAEDLVQDTFAEAHRRWERISVYDKPGAWLRRVMVNKATSRGRRLMTEAKGITKLASRRQDAVELPEDSSEIWEAVRRLPKRQAQVIALHYWEDLGISEIAGILECGEETVKTHLKRSRAKLATQIERESR